MGNPIPAGLRELRGGRKRPQHKDEVPDASKVDALPPSSTKVEPPLPLEPGEQKYWSYFAPLLAMAKMLTPADAQTLVDYCRACYWAEITNKRLRTAWRRTGRRFDRQHIRQLDTQLRGWVERKTALADRLGLTALSRTKTSWTGHSPVIDPKVRPKSKVAELQERSRALRRPVPVADPSTDTAE